MKKLGIAALAAASLVGAGAQTAQAAEAVDYKGPCATQRDLFATYNIQTDMDAPAVGWAYGTVCSVTG
jgi:hypothetical protein